jgi:hypothetical protein
MSSGAAPAGAGASEPSACASCCGTLWWVLTFPFRLVWHAIAIYFLPCLGSYAESLAWNLCCFVCLACGWRYKARPCVRTATARSPRVYADRRVPEQPG